VKQKKYHKSNNRINHNLNPLTAKKKILCLSNNMALLKNVAAKINNLYLRFEVLTALMLRAQSVLECNTAVVQVTFVILRIAML
jgi:hypothetical protein